MGGMICLGVVPPQVEWQWWGGSARAETGGCSSPPPLEVGNSLF